MPYKTKKLPKRKVQVVNTDTGQVMAKSTTPSKAKKQINLLNHIHKDKKKK
jgi:hypothetical protein